MPTQLETVFDFTADDLVANTQGKLSEEQQAERDDELSSLRSFVTGCTFAQIAIPFMIAINWVTGSILAQDVGPFVSITVFLFISGHFMIRTRRKRLKFLRKGELLRSPILRKEQFAQTGTSTCCTFHVYTEYLHICLSLRQYDTLQPLVDYRFFVWTHGSESPSDIFAVEQLDGMIQHCSLLERAFKFSADDVSTNKNMNFTLYQVCEHYDGYSFDRDTQYVAIADYSFLALVILWAVIQDQPAIVVIYGLLLTMMLFVGGHLYRNLFREQRKNRQMLDYGQPSVAADMRQADFTEGERFERTIYWFDDEDGVRFELSVAQWNALDEDVSYTFYYLPSFSDDPHSIISVEKLEDTTP